jgi:predicted  nucleic acid-binding Zn-ribbon protein
MDDNATNRLSRLESEIDDLHKDHRALMSTINNINITMALLQQTLKDVKQDQQMRAAFNNKIIIFLIGGFLSAVIAFVVRGGLLP